MPKGFINNYYVIFNSGFETHILASLQGETECYCRHFELVEMIWAFNLHKIDPGLIVFIIWIVSWMGNYFSSSWALTMRPFSGKRMKVIFFLFFFVLVTENSRVMWFSFVYCSSNKSVGAMCVLKWWNIRGKEMGEHSTVIGLCGRANKKKRERERLS